MKFAKIVVAVLLVAGACGCSTENEPQLTVTVVVTGIPSKAEYEQVEKTLKAMVSGPVRYTSSSWTGETLTIQLSPVGNVREFSSKIKFGNVTETQGNTIKVAFAKQQGA